MFIAAVKTAGKGVSQFTSWNFDEDGRGGKGKEEIIKMEFSSF